MTTSAAALPDGAGKPEVGWIGLGDQGLPMAVAVAEAGYPLHTWTRRPTHLTEVPGGQHEAHASLAELAEASDIVALCVNTDDDVAGLLTGGLLDALRAGSVVVNHGTGTPDNARRFAALCAGVGVESLDAPVSGGRPGAVDRRLITIAGGSRTAFDSCAPVMSTFSREVVHLGEAGAGQIAKLFNNALMILNQASIADIFELAAQSGTDPVRLFEVLKNASAGSTVLGLLTTMITSETVGHLNAVANLDLDVFDEAMRQAGLDASAVTARGRAGLERLPELVRTLTVQPA